MKWGSFGPVHLASLAAAALLVMGLYYILRNRSAKVQTVVLGILSFSGIAAIIFNLVAWGSPLEYLPFHLCSLNALVLPAAVLTRNKTLCNLLLVWSLGALAALVVNTAQANFELLSPTFGFYYFPHVLEFGIPILLFKLGLVKKDAKCILSTIVITMAVYTGVHFINVGINAYCTANHIADCFGELIQVNYMYSLVPEIPLLSAFWSVIPHEYWYMFMIVPIVTVYLLLVYAPQFLAQVKKRKVTA